MNPDLAAFLEHARAKGMDHATIRMLLLAAGWKEKEVAKALAEHALDMPVPAPPDAGGARDAFLHLVMFAALYAAAISVVSLLFHFINRVWPDPAMGEGALASDWVLRGMRWCLATLIVSFPVFVWLSRFLLREMAAQHEKAWSGVRRWLTYLTLFAAAIALAADLVTLLYFLLEGETSFRFVLKVIVVGVVAGMASTYYMATARMPARVLAASRMHRAFGAVAMTLVAVTVVLGMIIVGSPLAERSRKLDERRVADLRRIERGIDRVCLGPFDTRPDGPPKELVRPLPASLSTLADAPLDYRPEIVDPETKAPYAYRITGPSSYELCASFSNSRDDDNEPFWNHQAGRHCWSIDVLKPQ